MICEDTPPMSQFIGGWVYGLVDGWGHVKSLKSNKSWANQNNSILFEDL